MNWAAGKLTCVLTEHGLEMKYLEELFSNSMSGVGESDEFKPMC